MQSAGTAISVFYIIAVPILLSSVRPLYTATVLDTYQLNCPKMVSVCSNGAPRFPRVAGRNVCVQHSHNTS